MKRWDDPQPLPLPAVTSAGNQTWDDLDDVGRDVGDDGGGDIDDYDDDGDHDYDNNYDGDDNCIMMTETKIWCSLTKRQVKILW